MFGMDTNLTIIFLGICISIFLLIKTTVYLIDTIRHNNFHKRRLNALKQKTIDKKQSSNQQFESLVETIIQNLFPKLDNMLPSLQVHNKELLGMKLKFVNWNTYTPDTFIATSILLKILGIVLFIFAFIALQGELKFLIAGMGLVFMFYLDFSLNGEVKNKKAELMSSFPEFIRIVSGYLSADMILVDAISDSLKYVGTVWRPILVKFLADCDTIGQMAALDNLKNTVDIFEVKEFVSLVRLTIEQGGDVKDGFVQQADKITEIKKNQLIIKVGTRKMYAQMLAGPLMLAGIILFAAPIVSDAMKMFK